MSFQALILHIHSCIRSFNLLSMKGMCGKTGLQTPSTPLLATTHLVPYFSFPNLATIHNTCGMNINGTRAHAQNKMLLLSCWNC